MHCGRSRRLCFALIAALAFTFSGAPGMAANPKTTVIRAFTVKLENMNLDQYLAVLTRFAESNVIPIGITKEGPALDDVAVVVRGRGLRIIALPYRVSRSDTHLTFQVAFFSDVDDMKNREEILKYADQLITKFSEIHSAVVNITH